MNTFVCTYKKYMMWTRDDGDPIHLEWNEWKNAANIQEQIEIIQNTLDFEVSFSSIVSCEWHLRFSYFFPFNFAGI